MKRMTLWFGLFLALVLVVVGAVPVAGQSTQADGPGSVPGVLPPSDWQALQTQGVRLIPDDQVGPYEFGASVSMSGDVAIVGAPYAEVDGHQSQGAVYVFYRDQGGPNAWGQVAKLTSSDWDIGNRFGGAVSLSGDTAIVGAEWADAGGYLYQGAAYVFCRNQGGSDAWGQVAKLIAADGTWYDQFGSDVAVDGDTAVVGASGADLGGNEDQGAAYVFYRNQGGPDGWGQVAKLTAADGGEEDDFGSVSLNGDTILVGASGYSFYQGAAYVFYRNQGGPDAWGQVARLTAAHGDGFPVFGVSVSVSGDTALIGAPGTAIGGNPQQGAAYVFYRNQGGDDAWGQVAKLTFEAHNRLKANFGSSVSLDGDTAIAGARYLPVGGNREQGAAFVFSRNQGGGAKSPTPEGGSGDAWGQVEKLTAADGEVNDSYGASVSVDGSTAVVGAPYAHVGGNHDWGAAYVYALPALHLRLLELAWQYATQPGTYRVTATVRVHNELHARTGGVTVQGDWILPDGSVRNKAGLTNREGEAKLTLWVTHAGSYQFCVTGLAKAGCTYDPDANEVPACQSIMVGP